MSPSESGPIPQRESAELELHGPAGVELQILDGDLNLVARGSIMLKATLKEGVYVARWVAGGQVYQEFHRLFGVAQPLVLPHGLLPPEIVNGALNEALPVPRLASAGAESARIVERPWTVGESEVVVFQHGDAGARDEDALPALRLFNAGDVAMRSDAEGLETDPPGSRPSLGQAMRLYRVPHGVYRLRYDSPTGEAVEQAIPAFPDRRTLVFLKLGLSSTPASSGDELTWIDRVGVNPATTRLVSVRAETAAKDNAEELRLAELVERGLAATSSPLDGSTLAQILAENADPLLKIATAALIVLRLEEGVEPGLENEVFKLAPEDPSPGLPNAIAGAARNILRSVAKTLGDRRREGLWRRRAAQLIRAADPSWSISDSIAIAWRLRASGERFADPIPASLSEPTILDCTWRWAVAESAVRPESMPNHRSLRVPARGRVPAGPWLAWRASAAKELAVEGEARAEGSFSKVLAKLSATAARLDLSSGRKSETAQELLSTLTVETRRIIANTQSLMAGEGSAAYKLYRFTESLAAPTLVLQAQVEAALQELEGATAAALLAEPPALSRPVAMPDDPNKGRFGGEASRDGFTLSATFHASPSSWVLIHLVVIADDPSGAAEQSVEFFLHDTFRPNRMSAVFQGGEATLDVTAVGGFTVGAWIAAKAVELELDLALIPGAPQVIREL